MKDEKVIFSGAGGQGLMFIGKLFAQLVVEKFPHITFIPSYGAEVRGGTSNCRVTLSSEEIASPIVEKADSLIVMNQPSADRFLSLLAEGGTLFINSSLVEAPGGVDTVSIPATEWAQELGDIRCSNVIMLGAYLRRKNYFAYEEVEREIVKISSRKGAAAEKMNAAALKKGWSAAGA